MKYTVYKGEEYLKEGTAQQLSEYFNVKVSTIYFWASPINFARDKGDRKVAYRLEGN